MYARTPVMAYRAAYAARVSYRAYAPAYYRAYSVGSSVTYSGGQASEGQGGFYGSGGSRVSKGEVPHNKDALADMPAYNRLADLMSEVDQIASEASSRKPTSDEALSAKSAIKKLVTSSEFTELLGRLEMNGGPKWGLSEAQREVVKAARHHVDYS